MRHPSILQEIHKSAIEYFMSEQYIISSLDSVTFLSFLRMISYFGIGCHDLKKQVPPENQGRTGNEGYISQFESKTLRSCAHIPLISIVVIFEVKKCFVKFTCIILSNQLLSC